AVCGFGTLEGAVDTVIQTIQSGVPVARIELLDDVQIDAINRYAKLDLPVRNALFLEFHGTNAGVKEQAEIVQAIASE
ncbi:FAD-linked oxidase C-terminal domain-containing protein, partial [Klebsiella pneumoniae]|uniref:FAD-linked oxidase C-terminal domain-containing protein n=1 Tax=Klebsiella pneumoniae TaxID=573 RepID=UPI0038531341